MKSSSCEPIFESEKDEIAAWAKSEEDGGWETSSKLPLNSRITSRERAGELRLVNQGT